MVHTTKKIITVTLTCVYLILALAGSFAVFHHHQMPVQETSKQESPELHDASCDIHVKAHIHLSEHCAACQFTANKQSCFQYVLNLLNNQKSAEHLFFYSVLPSSQPHLSKAAGRAPPSFLS